MKKKIIKRTLLALLWIAIIIGACIFPYPALFMGNSLPKQPELSVSEKRYFDKLKREQHWGEISRMYSNIDSIGRDIRIRDIPIDFNSKYVYSIFFETQDTTSYYTNCTQEKAFAFAKYIRDSICLNSLHLFGIGVGIKYKDTIKDSHNSMYEFYQFYIKKDSVKLKKELSLILWEDEK